MGTNQWAELK